MNIDFNSKINLGLSARRKKQWKTILLFILFAVIFMLLGWVSCYSYSAVSSKATSTGGLTFAINGHKGTFNMENGELIGYDTQNTLYTKFYFSADTYYTTNANVNILMGKEKLDNTAYTYSSGELSIINVAIIDAITINVDFIGIAVGVNLNTGGSTISTSVNYDSPMTTVSTPSKTGYEFTGYYDAISGGIQYYDANGESVKDCDFTSAKTLYAHWTPIVYTIFYNLDGGVGSGNPTKYTIET